MSEWPAGLSRSDGWRAGLSRYDDWPVGLSRHDDVLSEAEQAELVAFAEHMLLRGREGSLAGKSYLPVPDEWVRRGQVRSRATQVLKSTDPNQRSALPHLTLPLSRCY